MYLLHLELGLDYISHMQIKSNKNVGVYLQNETLSIYIADVLPMVSNIVVRSINKL